MQHAAIYATTTTGWHTDAACQGKPTAWWYDPTWAARARAICRSCPVMLRCLDAGLEGNETGIWGGRDDEQRRHLASILKPRRALICAHCRVTFRALASNERRVYCSAACRNGAHRRRLDTRRYA
jgi:hypothetical protein